MTASRTPILPLAFEHLILASFRKIKTNLAAASSPAARQTSPRFGDKANPLSFEGLLDFHDGGEIALSYPLPLFNSAKPLITIPAMAWANTLWFQRGKPNPDPAPGVVVEEADSRVLKG